MKIFDGVDFGNTKKLLTATYELMEATEDLLKQYQEEAKKLEEAIEDYEMENGGGDRLADEARNNEIGEMN